MSMTPEEQAKVMDLLGEPGPFDLGVRFERERIIKLLKQHGVLQPHRWERDAEIMALIKGEHVR